MVQFVIDRCHADPTDFTLCVEVCRIAMASLPYDRIDACDVTFDDTHAAVVATYSNYVGGEGCAPVVPDAPPVQDAP